MRPDDAGPGRPPLPPDAGPKERTLYEVYDVQTGVVDLTAAGWRTSAESVRGLSAEVRGIVNALRGAPDAWTGPAAEAAYATLGKLAENLEVHAEDIDRIEAGLTSAYDSVTTARAEYVNRVRTLSLEVDPADYQRRDPAAPPQLPLEDAKVLDRSAYDAAVADARAAREKEAAAVLAGFTDSMTTATKKLPVDPVERTPVGDGSPSGGGGAGGTGGGGSAPSGSSYAPPGGGTGVRGPQPTDGGGGDPPPPTQTVDVTGPGGDPGQVDGPGTRPPTVVGPPPVLDGPVDGGLTPAGPGGPSGTGPVAGSTGAPGTAGGVGPGGAAAGVGGVVAGGGAAALLGRGGMPGGAAGRLPAAFGGGRAGGSGSGAAGRAGGSASAAGRSSVLAGGGQGGAGRGGTGGRGSPGGNGARGGTRTGRYGVPKLGERAGGRSAVGGAGGAGSRGQRKDRDEAGDVEHLTTEDEQTWFEGADDATPPVWD